MEPSCSPVFIFSEEESFQQINNADLLPPLDNSWRNIIYLKRLIYADLRIQTD